MEAPPVAREWREDLYRQEANRPEPDRDTPSSGWAPGPKEWEGSNPLSWTTRPNSSGSFTPGSPGPASACLVRTNKVVSYIIAALRKLGIPASGEGGTPLTDAAPVNALLALLRLADHPGDRLARYHVAQTPVGEMVGYTSHQAGAEANRLARRIRGQLLRDGYGFTLDRWAKEPGFVLQRARAGPPSSAGGVGIPVGRRPDPPARGFCPAGGEAEGRGPLGSPGQGHDRAPVQGPPVRCSGPSATSTLPLRSPATAVPSCLSGTGRRAGS